MKVYSESLRGVTVCNIFQIGFQALFVRNILWDLCSSKSTLEKRYKPNADETTFTDCSKSRSEAENDTLEDSQRICPSVARQQEFKRKGRVVVSPGPAS